MSKTIIYLLLAVSLGLNIGVIGMTLIQDRGQVSQDRPPRPDNRRGEDPGQRPNPKQFVDGHLRGITRHLDLNADQQKTIRTVMEQFAPQIIELQAEVGKTGRRVSDTFAAPSFDPVQFQQLTAKASAARAQLDSLSAVMLVAEAAQLTPEQRLKFAGVASSMHSAPLRPMPGDGPPPRR